MRRFVVIIMLSLLFLQGQCGINNRLFDWTGIDSISITYTDWNSHDVVIRITPDTAFFRGTYYSNYRLKSLKTRLKKSVTVNRPLSNEDLLKLSELCNQIYIRQEKPVYLSIEHPEVRLSDFPELSFLLHTKGWGTICYSTEIGDVSNRAPHLAGYYIVQYSDTFIELYNLFCRIDERMLQEASFESLTNSYP